MHDSTLFHGLAPGVCALLLAGCFSPSDATTDADTDSDTASASGSQGDDGSGGPGSSSQDGDGSGGPGSDSDAPTSSADDQGDTSDATDDGVDDTAGDSEGSSGDVPDTTAPEIVSISPAAGATGVLADTDIVITFSEAMDTAATEAAFASADLPGVNLVWSEGDTVLTIDPDADLQYAQGSDPAQVVANEYALSIGVGATDVAGNALEREFQSSFATLRAISTTLTSDAALTGAVASDGTLVTGAAGDAVAGDHADNLQRKGFLSFSLASLPAGVVGAWDATLLAQQTLTLGSPFGAPPGLGALNMHHVQFGALDGTAFGTAALADLGLFSNAATNGTRTMDVTASVDDDIVSGRAYSQFRVEFPTATNNNGATDRTRFTERTIELVYLVE